MPRLCRGIGSESDCRSRVMSLIPAWSYTLVEIDREIFSMVILLLPLIQEGLVLVTCKQKHVLVNSLVKPAQEKKVVRLTDHTDMTIAV